MSILHFVRQYEKIQEKCLVPQEGNDFKTDEKERRRWSKYPIEKHASTIYTKNLFYRFSKEFEKTAEYDVKPEGLLQYLLVPNNRFVFGYGKRSYVVTAIEEEGSYYCECSKFDRDGIICCHIMKILTRLGVKTIPDRYVKKRWTKEAVTNTEVGHEEADFIARGMPLHNERTLWFSNLSVAFADLAAEGSCSNEAYSMMQEHIKIMRSAVNEIKKREMTRQSGAASTTGSVPVVMHAMDVGGPGRNAALSIAATTAITPAGTCLCRLNNCLKPTIFNSY